MLVLPLHALMHQRRALYLGLRDRLLVFLTELAVWHMCVPLPKHRRGRLAHLLQRALRRRWAPPMGQK